MTKRRRTPLGTLPPDDSSGVPLARGSSPPKRSRAITSEQREASGTIENSAPLERVEIEVLDDEVETRKVPALPADAFDTSDEVPALTPEPDARLEAHKRAIEAALAAEDRGKDPADEPSVIVQIDDDWLTRLDLPPE